MFLPQFTPLCRQFLTYCTPQKSDNTFDNLTYKPKKKRTADVDELTRYLAAVCVDIEDPIAWWLENAHTYPRLSRMALDYLMIPGTLSSFSAL
jgi:hypothetical protein